ncbi:cytochrome c biogenesis protein CcsA [candidate division KSB1 bacterium]|nr:cytochrome c biogenesis protein CcsA [candidate division KSB1 bacterium]
MKLIQTLFFSMPAMVVMVLVIALSIGTATFIETHHDSETARAVIYNAWWMTILYVMLAINLIMNLIRFRMWRREKWLSGLFHAAFLLILLGAALTRYFGEEGILHFREGESTDQVLSSRSYFQATLESENKTTYKEHALWLSRISPVRFSEQLQLDDQTITVHCTEYIPHAVPKLIEDEKGGPVLLLSVSEEGISYPLTIQSGETKTIGSILLNATDLPPDSGDFIHIYFQDDSPHILSSLTLGRVSMREGMREQVPPLTEIILEPGVLISTSDFRFAMQQFILKGRISAENVELSNSPMAADEPPDALLVDVAFNGMTQQVALFGGSGFEGDPIHLQINEAELTLTFGSKSTTLPFGLELIDFEIERYPGSRMPSSFASEVIIHDEEMGIERPFRIYMNHILKYRGYRFFQSSFDEDEAGSVLSWSHDPGTVPTYIGYFLCVIALILSLCNPNGRFRKLAKRITANRSAVILILGLGFGFLYITPLFAADSTDEAMAMVRNIERDHGLQFGRLIVQDMRGRMKPVNSLSHEIMFKLRYPDRFLGVHPDQLSLALWLRPELSQILPLIRVENTSLRDQLGLMPEETHISIMQMMSKQTGQNILDPVIQSAESKTRSQRNGAEKEALAIRDRMAYCQMIQQGGLFRIFPLPDVSTQQWTAYTGASQMLDSTHAAPILNLVKSCKSEVENAISSQQWHKVNTTLLDISAWQSKYGFDLLPSDFQCRVEVFYNEINIFQKLAFWTLVLGLVLLVFETIQMLRYFKWLGRMAWLSGFGLVLCFLSGTVGLILRWIAAAHPPWTNKYESMIYIAWTILLAGVVFLRKARMSLAGAGMLSGLILTVANTASFDPKLTNLHPVLKSHWLITHVSVITASYGFFGLGAVLGLITLVFILFRGQKREQGLASPMLALYRVIEQSLLMGLVLITIGNFFGAVWANESWGRYWGWDPKETWTLIVILVYTIVLHLRFIPKLNSPYVLATGSVVALFAVAFTYIGVNLYLSGMHSYASGDKPTLPIGFFIGLIVLFLIIIFAGRRKKT